MTFSVTMPALGESVSEGTVTRWLKAEGDHVNVDEPLLEVSTDKVDTEIPSPVSGTLQKIVVQVDQTVPVGAELAIIADSAGASTPAPAVAPVASAPAPVAATPAPQAPAAPAATGAGTVITMPALGESVSEGTVTRWLKNVGDAVAVDEALLEVSTDKVDTEIPSPVSGTLQKIVVQIDQTVHPALKVLSLNRGQGLVPPLLGQLREDRTGLTPPHSSRLGRREGRADQVALHAEAGGLAVATSIGLVCRAEQGGWTPHLLEKLGIEETGIVLLQPGRHLAERIGHLHFPRGEIGHRGQQHIGGLRPIE